MRHCLGREVFQFAFGGDPTLNCHRRERIEDPCDNAVPCLVFPTMNIYRGFDPCHCHHKCDD